MKQKKRPALPVVAITVLLLLCTQPGVHAQSCAVNAGINQSVCTSTATLSGNINGTSTGSATWTFVSGPAGITPVIAAPGNLTTAVSGMTVPGNYIFRLSQPCQFGGTASQTVTVTANPEPSGLAIITPAMVECANYAAVNTVTATPLPPGWTGEWTVRDAGFNTDVTSQFTLSSPNSPTTDVQLLPANQTCGNRGYLLRWRITSPNGLCSYDKTVSLRYYPDINDIVFPSTINKCGPGSIVFSPTTCAFWNLFLPGTTATVSLLTAPAGFGGTITAVPSNPNFTLNGFTSIGTYTFNLTVNIPACGTSKVFGPFTANISDGTPSVTVSSTPANFCQASGPASITYQYTLTDPSVIMSIESVPAGYTYSLNGVGTLTPSITITPISGWITGELRFPMRFRHPSDPTGACANRIVHSTFIYDNLPAPAATIPNTTACIPLNGSTASAVITLPTLNIGYLGSNFPSTANWQVTKISGPATGGTGSAFIYSPSITLTGLTAGVYNLQASPTGFGIEEANCSGGVTPLTFSITVYNQQGANAGNDRTVACIQDLPLSANQPIAPSVGTWTQVSGPSTVSFTPTANDPNAVAKVIGTPSSGSYVFRWTISDPNGNCPPVSDDINVNMLGICAPPLPVTLLSFTAVKQGEQVMLNWATATEINSKDFVVEWSLDANHWSVIGSKAGAGNSNARIDYNLMHTTPGKGINYYRLRMNDLDGSFKNSSIVMIRLTKDGKLSVLPNPVKDQLFVSGLRVGSKLRLSSTDGKIVWTGTATSENTTIQVQHLQPALYLLSVQDPLTDTKEVLKVIKK